jgi:hypothetical protein
MNIITIQYFSVRQRTSNCHQNLNERNREEEEEDEDQQEADEVDEDKHDGKEEDNGKSEDEAIGQDDEEQQEEKKAKGEEEGSIKIESTEENSRHKTLKRKLAKANEKVYKWMAGIEPNEIEGTIGDWDKLSLLKMVEMADQEIREHPQKFVKNN